ncbi:MAG TPA: protein phosphatase 2C domain-containing protein [Bryobacteraceae bacterium]|nr:protein phosphatase 2C domain-containing protein [Bryobacteraceae bacterium]
MLEAFGLSDQGCVRANNEDYFIVDGSAGIFVLADGMGGERAGECASRLSAEMIYHYLLETSGAPNYSDIGTIEHGFQAVNTAVRHAAHENAELQGMGTTLVVARVVEGNRLQVGSVGDSRAYLVSGGLLSLLTEDQTWVREIGRPLGLTEDELRHHPMKHVLTMAMGTPQELRVHSSTAQMNVGDQVLLCSDGLHGVVAQDVLQNILNSELPASGKCHLLVDTAKQLGAPDNVTVVLVSRL